MKTNRTDIIRKRYDRISGIFDVMERMIKKEWRADLLSKAEGEVLEVGVGTGANLSYYPPRAAGVTGIDFSPGMLRYAKQKALHTPFPVTLLEMDAQHLDFPDNSFDYVVATCVFCSVPDPIAGLKEIRRVCKPDGKVLLLEHMRSEQPLLGLVMDVLNPVTVRISGANINRRTLQNIEKAGLRIEENVPLMGSIVRSLVLNPDKPSK
ncbi:class I SAM-dependent methyltransferase [Paenibacillus sp. 7124]|uniref:Class I SAM-dependent methyltransferase n=1 Tax=Paenibacillus apii TaxID=1850370 RepID=A0A6M1PR74_9BACL|nr:class I SAM-dependent methyltransferase [Paenibacillus apii]NGM84243.1 class I SAM-dependent methyltransferase [Paenibacillus apii]NJJ40862.1 class I SAM-dependent methyltransferase [Paenibacillus apii]